MYVLFEHQSSVDRRMPARLLVYMARIWDQWMRAHPSGKLPLIVPAVVHHSSTGWTSSTRFPDVLELPDAIRAALSDDLLDFGLFLDDLTRSTNQELRDRARMAAGARLALSLMRLGRNEAPADVHGWARLLRQTLGEPDGLRAFETVLRYLADVRDDDFIDVLVKATNDREVEAIAMTYRERLIEEGRKKGHDEGVRRVLAKQLQLKFGSLSESAEACLAAASLDELETWASRVLTAEDIDAVFES